MADSGAKSTLSYNFCLILTKKYIFCKDKIIFQSLQNFDFLPQKKIRPDSGKKYPAKY
jgi:hypothetical protein